MYEKIMELLKERGKTMSDLSREAEIPYTSLKNMEYRGDKGGLSVKNLKKVARFFGITLDELCEGV